jgi:hypothetical protein
MFEGMSPPVSFRDRIPPGFITLVAIYGLGLGFLAIIRYFGVVEIFFRKQLLNDVAIFAVIGGPIYMVFYFFSYFHPEWRD